MQTTITMKHERVPTAMRARANHHAKALRPFVDRLLPMMDRFGFTKIHMTETSADLIAADGRKFKVRGIQGSGARYKGLEIWRMCGRALTGEPMHVYSPDDAEKLLGLLA